MNEGNENESDYIEKASDMIVPDTSKSGLDREAVKIPKQLDPLEFTSSVFNRGAENDVRCIDPSRVCIKCQAEMAASAFLGYIVPAGRVQLTEYGLLRRM